jgi:hypothetical protein
MDLFVITLGDRICVKGKRMALFTLRKLRNCCLILESPINTKCNPFLGLQSGLGVVILSDLGFGDAELLPLLFKRESRQATVRSAV